MCTERALSVPDTRGMLQAARTVDAEEPGACGAPGRAHVRTEPDSGSHWQLASEATEGSAPSAGRLLLTSGLLAGHRRGTIIHGGFVAEVTGPGPCETLSWLEARRARGPAQWPRTTVRGASHHSQHQAQAASVAAAATPSQADKGRQ